MKFRSFDKDEDVVAYLGGMAEEAREIAVDMQEEIAALTHGTFFVSIRKDLGIVIYGKVIEHSKYPEDDEGIAESRKNGYIFGKCYSVMCTYGELGSTHVSRITGIIPEAVFNTAKANGFRHATPSD